METNNMERNGMDRTEFYAFLSQILPEVDWDSPAALMESGELDSLDVLMLAGELYERMRIEIPSSQLKAENFASKESIWTLVSACAENGKKTQI